MALVVLVRQSICLRALHERAAVVLHDRVQVGEVGIAEAVLERIARLPPVDLPRGQHLRWPVIRYCRRQVQAGGEGVNFLADPGSESTEPAEDAIAQVAVSLTGKERARTLLSQIGESL